MQGILKMIKERKWVKRFLKILEKKTVHYNSNLSKLLYKKGNLQT